MGCKVKYSLFSLHLPKMLSELDEMPDSLTDVLYILENYKYIIVFPLTVLEGPVISIISGFLVYLGVMNFWGALAVLVVADVLGDCMYHMIGRYSLRSNWARKMVGFFGYSDRSEAFLEQHFKKYRFKTFLFAKFAHGVGAVIQIASGIARVNFGYFFIFSLLSTIPKILILLTIGFYAGSSIAKIDGILSTVALVVFSASVLLIIGYVTLNKHVKNFFAK